jgi:hypothetical protein
MAGTKAGASYSDTYVSRFQCTLICCFLELKSKKGLSLNAE